MEELQFELFEEVILLVTYWKLLSGFIVLNDHDHDYHRFN